MVNVGKYTSPMDPMGKVHHRSLTVSLPLKNGCWKTILFYWGGLIQHLFPDKKHVRNTTVANQIKYIELMQDFVTNQQYHTQRIHVWYIYLHLP